MAVSSLSTCLSQPMPIQVQLLKPSPITKVNGKTNEASNKTVTCKLTTVGKQVKRGVVVEELQEQAVLGVHVVWQV